MDNAPPTQQPDPAALRLQRDIYYQLVHTLCAMLPGPPSDTPEEHARRYRVAIGHVAALAPANADEADIAAHYVAASAHASDCLRLAVYNASDPPVVVQLNAQSTSMMRQARGYRSLLLRVQAARHKREADNEAREQDAWTEHCALGMMTQALDDLAPMPMRAPAPPAAPVAAPRPSPAPAPVAARTPPQPVRDEPDELDELDDGLGDGMDDDADMELPGVAMMQALLSLPRGGDSRPLDALLQQAKVNGAKILLHAANPAAVAEE